ncbi:MAG: ribosomal protein [Candidatus Parcubacteria bacterium]|jgi:large subunit ribosomal protein L10
MERLTKAFKGAKAVTFADYKGLTVPQVDALRGKAREAGVEYIVAKKTLLTRAAKDAGYDLDAKTMPGMLGAAFSADDEVASAKILGDASKGTSLTLVGGIFEGAFVPKEKVDALSKLPGKHDLLGMLVGTLNGLPAALVRALNAIREQKEEPKTEDAAPAEAAPAPAETPAEAPAPEQPAA